MSQTPDEILVNTNVLVVDDEEQNQYLLEVLLKSEKCNVTCAGNGQEALEYLKKDLFDLIISDILMPKMDGFQLCRECKSDPRLKDIPFVFYTATYKDKKDEEFALSMGAERFIRKPEEPKAFVALLREVINQRQVGRKVAVKETPVEEVVYLKLYNETLIRKLEDKMLALEQEISERKRTEEKLRESEKRYREMYDFLPIPVYEMDLEANITSANRAIYETFGATEEDLKAGFKARQILSPENVDKSNKNIQRMLQGEIIESTEYTLKRIDGSVFPAIVISRVIYRNGKPAGLRGAIVNIEEHKRDEEELRRVNALLDSVIENIPNMIFLKDADNLRFVQFNRAGEALLGYSRNDLLGKNDYDFFPKEQADFFTEKNREVLHGMKFVDVPEESIQTRNKGERTLHTKKVPILDVHGKPEYLLGISEDITERKQAEEKLQNTLESLRKAVNTTINVMVSTVEARDPYTFGHQIRSANLAGAIATEMGLPQEKIDATRMTASIHDIGKISIPAEILSKPTRLSEIEFSLIKEHARKGYEMLKDVESPWPLAEIVYQHHERMDGSGYPRNLKGEEICLEARILTVADVVEAMASHRPYRAGLGIDAALNEIEKNRGIFYDSTVADACLKLFREKGFQLAVA